MKYWAILFTVILMAGCWGRGLSETELQQNKLISQQEAKIKELETELAKRSEPLDKATKIAQDVQKALNPESTNRALIYPVDKLTAEEKVKVLQSLVKNVTDLVKVVKTKDDRVIELEGELERNKEARIAQNNSIAKVLESLIQCRKDLTKKNSLHDALLKEINLQKFAVNEYDKLNDSMNALVKEIQVKHAGLTEEIKFQNSYNEFLRKEIDKEKARKDRIRQAFTLAAILQD